jgi:hypothetical protein
MPRHRLPSKSMLQWVASFTTIVSRKMFSQSCAYSDARPIYSYTVRRLCWFSNKSHSRRIPKSSTTQSTQQQNKTKHKHKTEKRCEHKRSLRETQANAVCLHTVIPNQECQTVFKTQNPTAHETSPATTVLQQTASNTSNHLRKQTNTCHVALDRRFRLRLL